MDSKLIKKLYKISRIIIAIITFIVFNIMYINEDISWKILPIFFAVLSYGFSFPSSIISERLMNFTDKIKNRIVKFLLYIIFMPTILFFLFLALYRVIMYFFDKMPTPNELGAALNQALTAVFIVTIGTIFLIVPYIQTIIVLILKKFIKE